MSDIKKTFDCIAMKNSIQSELLQEYEGLSLENERNLRRQKLMTSDSLAAQIWRNTQEPRKTALTAHEAPGAYTARKKETLLNEKPE